MSVSWSGSGQWLVAVSASGAVLSLKLLQVNAYKRLPGTGLAQPAWPGTPRLPCLQQPGRMGSFACGSRGSMVSSKSLIAARRGLSTLPGPAQAGTSRPLLDAHCGSGTKTGGWSKTTPSIRIRLPQSNGKRTPMSWSPLATATCSSGGQMRCSHSRRLPGRVPCSRWHGARMPLSLPRQTGRDGTFLDCELRKGVADVGLSDEGSGVGLGPAIAVSCHWRRIVGYSLELRRERACKHKARCAGVSSATCQPACLPASRFHAGIRLRGRAVGVVEAEQEDGAGCNRFASRCDHRSLLVARRSVARDGSRGRKLGSLQHGTDRVT